MVLLRLLQDQEDVERSGDAFWSGSFKMGYCFEFWLCYLVESVRKSPSGVLLDCSSFWMRYCFVKNLKERPRHALESVVRSKDKCVFVYGALVYFGSLKMGYCFVGDVLRRLESGEKECWYVTVDRDLMGIVNR